MADDVRDPAASAGTQDLVLFREPPTPCTNHAAEIGPQSAQTRRALPRGGATCLGQKNAGETGGFGCDTIGL
jgi:hypothetical protein